MSDERKTLELRLKDELSATTALLAGQKNRPQTARYPAALSDLYGSRSLLEICADVLKQSQASLGQPIRTLHHFACSGGTLFAKITAALPNVFVLSEVHPHSQLVKPAKYFAPSDIALLSRAAALPDIANLTEKLFVDALSSVHEWTTRRGGRLIFRDHAHSDFCMPNPLGESLLLKLLGARYNKIIPVVTVRHPADSFAAVKVHNFISDSSKNSSKYISFETYCDRYSQFLDAVEPDLIVKYEDLLKEPTGVLKQMCDVWSLSYDELALDIFSQFQLSGDSGRSGGVIAERPPRPESKEYRQSDAESYVRLISRLGYSLR
ncbi:MAG: hypothetical protein P8N17_09460 [Luminiphilus sp.]|nr:hypothetical protein [Luminiphilus sp.]